MEKGVIEFWAKIAVKKVKEKNYVVGKFAKKTF